MNKLSEDLADRLAKNLKPVKPLAHPAVRAAGTAGFALAAVAACLAALGGPRKDWADMLRLPSVLETSVAMLGAAFSAALAAFILAVPDTKIRTPVRALLGLATVLWIEICMASVITLTPGDITAEFSAWAASRACVAGLLIMTTVPLIFSFVLTLRAAPLWRGWSGYALALSAASFGAIGMRFLCPSDAPEHLLLWHFLPVLVLAGVGTVLGKLILRFKK
jgi:hypothetical protein